MEIEHRIMRQIMRISANVRRRKFDKQPKDMCKSRGFGHILDLLTENKGMSQQQIADSLDIRPQSVSEAIAAMENQGLICKVSNESDRRSSFIYITDYGVARKIELANERLAKAKEILAPLSENEKNTLVELLEKITSALQMKDEVI